MAAAYARPRPCLVPVLDIDVKVGDVGTANQPVAILEAMKMENEVRRERAPRYQRQTMVNLGDTLHPRLSAHTPTPPMRRRFIKRYRGIYSTAQALIAEL
ncbi:MAG: acetyl-CoA carboxylase biotin carboxyl carrier protein subunit [Eggerthellaceae bacterium]